MAEAFVFNVESLVTRDYLGARFGEFGARMEARMDVLKSDMNGKFRLVFWMLTALIGANAAVLSMVYTLAVAV